MVALIWLWQANCFHLLIAGEFIIVPGHIIAIVTVFPLPIAKGPSTCGSKFRYHATFTTFTKSIPYHHGLTLNRATV